MTLEFKKFIYSNSFKELNEKFDKNIPSTLLLSEKFIYFNNDELINFLKNNLIKWIIVIGDNSSTAEDDLDFIIEASLNNDDLDIITTNFSYADPEDIVFEFLVTSKLDYAEYQFLGMLNFEKLREIEIVDLINSSLNNKPWPV